MALVEAAKILRKHLNPFVQYAEPGPGDAARRAGRRRPPAASRSIAELERKLNMSLAELELSVRATNCLESEGITTVRDLVDPHRDELLEVRNFGETTLKEVKQKLAEHGLHLGMRVATRRSRGGRKRAKGEKAKRKDRHRGYSFLHFSFFLFHWFPCGRASAPPRCP